MAVRTNPGARAPESQGWKSAPNIILPVEDDLQEKYKPSETAGDFLSLPPKKRSLSLPNMAVGENSGGDAPEVGLPLGTSLESPFPPVPSAPYRIVCRHFDDTSSCCSRK
ncbi:unnamed protein product [Macrosiphum euphorbiae]|uniref:Uncharacterized protein n=1 Tax=Macrosiphum euphorbiae TaxID=13131 RepID=A0AAV0X177_9HEMI|nr:unnamed protein product [Macrosiphum euphorbiae]